MDVKSFLTLAGAYDDEVKRVFLTLTISSISFMDEALW